MFRFLTLPIGVTICLSLFLCLEARPYAFKEEIIPLDDGYDDEDAFLENGAEKRSADLSVSGSLAALTDMLMWQRQRQMKDELAALGKRTSGLNNVPVPAIFRRFQRLSNMNKRSGSDLSILGSLDALSDIIASQQAKHLSDVNHQRLLRLGKRDTSASLDMAEKAETKKAE